MSASSAKLWRLANPERYRAGRSIERRRRARIYRERILELLGESCRECGAGDTRRNPLEVHHVDGKAWSEHSANNADKFGRYLREHAAGVRLRILCRKCHAVIENNIRNKESVCK